MSVLQLNDFEKEEKNVLKDIFPPPNRDESVVKWKNRFSSAVFVIKATAKAFKRNML